MRTECCCLFEGFNIVKCMRGIKCCAMNGRMNVVESLVWHSFLLCSLCLPACLPARLLVQHSIRQTYKYGDRDNHHICIALVLCVVRSFVRFVRLLNRFILLLRFTAQTCVHIPSLGRNSCCTPKIT